MSDLLPCPFCASTKIDPEGWKNGEGKTGPVCDDCGASAESVEAWNRRAPSAEETRLRAEVASLRATLGQQPAADGAEPIGCPLPGACGAVRAHAAAFRAGAAEMRDAAAELCDVPQWLKDVIPHVPATPAERAEYETRINTARAIKDAIRALPLPASGWRPIATAPRDKMLLLGHAEDDAPLIGYWHRGAWRYLSPVLTPSEAQALRAEVEKLRGALVLVVAAAAHENWHLDCVLAKVLSDARAALAGDDGNHSPDTGKMVREAMAAAAKAKTDLWLMTEERDNLRDAAERLKNEREAVALAFRKLGAVLRVNMLRWVPEANHAMIDDAINACVGPAARAALGGGEGV